MSKRLKIKKEPAVQSSPVEAWKSLVFSIGILILMMPVFLVLQSCGKGAVEVFGYENPVLDSCASDPQHQYYVSVPENLPEEEISSFSDAMR